MRPLWKGAADADRRDRTDWNSRVKHSLALVVFVVAACGLASCGKSPDELSQQAKALLAKGQQEEARLLWQKAIQADPNHAGAHYELGLLDQKAERYAEAIEHFRSAAAGGEVTYLVQLGRTQLQAYLETQTSAGLAQQATDTARRLAGMPKGKAEAARIYGYLAVADRRAEDAIRHFTESLAAGQGEQGDQGQPGQEDVRLALLQQLLAAGRENDAVALLGAVKAGAAAGPVLADTYYSHVLAAKGCRAAEGVLEAQAGLYAVDEWAGRLRRAGHQRRCQGPAAEEAYLSGFRASAKPADALRLGDYYAEQANWSGALAEYERAAGQEGVEIRRSSALIGLNRFREAADLLTAYLQKNPKDANALGQRGLLLLNGEIRGANANQGLADLRAAIAQPEAKILPTLRFHLAASLLRLGLTREARQELQILEQVSAGGVGVQLLKAEFQLRENRAPAAEDLCRAILVQAPKLREARMILALSLAAQGKRDDAKKEWAKLAQEFPQDRGIALQYLAQLAGETSARAEFERRLAEIENVPGLDTGSRYLLAEILMASGQRAKGVAQLEKLYGETAEARTGLRLVELQLAEGRAAVACGNLERVGGGEANLPASQRGSWWALKAICLEQEQKTRDAIAAHRQALTYRPGDPVLGNNLASALAEQGQELEEALKLAEAAVAAQPNEVQYRDTLGWVLYKKKDQDRAAQIYQQLRKKKPLPENVEAHARQVLGR